MLDAVRQPVTTVGEVMTRQVVTVRMDTSVGDLAELFTEHGFHHLVVLDGGRLVGLVSDRDVLRATSPYTTTWSASAKDAALLSRKAHQIMSRQPVTAVAEMDICDAIRTMLEVGVSCLPVVDDERRCVGIVTWRDLLRTAFGACGVRAA